MDIDTQNARIAEVRVALALCEQRHPDSIALKALHGLLGKLLVDYAAMTPGIHTDAGDDKGP